MTAVRRIVLELVSGKGSTTRGKQSQRLKGKITAGFFLPFFFFAFFQAHSLFLPA